MTGQQGDLEIWERPLLVVPPSSKLQEWGDVQLES